jgi:PAS domain S-box-containing protein
MLLVLVAMLPSLFILLQHGMEEQRREASRAQDTALRQVLQFTDQEEAFARSSNQLLSVLAELPIIRDKDTESTSLTFAQLLARNPQYGNILSTDAEGIVNASGVPNTKRISLADRKHFRDAIQTKAFSTGEFILSRTTNRIVFPFSLPTLDLDDRPTGVLIAVQDLGSLDQIFSSLRLPEGSDLVVTDFKGVVVYQIGSPALGIGHGLTPQEQAPLYDKGPQGIFRAFDRQGVRRLYAYRALSLGPGQPPYMIFRIGIPERIALADSRHALMHNLLTLGLVFVGALILAWLLGGYLVRRPVQLLLDATSKLANGNWAAAESLPRDHSELGQLAASLNDLGATLRIRETALRSREQALRMFFDSVNDAIIVHDARAGKILAVNQRMCDMYGYAREEVYQLKPGSLNAGESPYGFTESLEWIRRAAEGQPQIFEWQARHRSGRLFWVECNLRRARIDDEDRVLAVVRDIQDRKEAEEERQKLERQVQQAQKLESLGVLAGGIAHDFNNLLTALLGNLSLAKDVEEPGHASHPFLEKAERVALRASDLTKQMLAYAGRGRADTQPLDLNEVVRDMSNLLIVSVPKKITLELRLAESLPFIEGDRTQIQQVVMNLVTNASEAIGDTMGQIHLRTACQELHEDTIVNALPGQPIEPGHYVLLEVQDTGCGIAPEHEPRIFDPFFSTKASGRGLGLSAMLGILRTHHGAIQVLSQPGKGSRFCLYFPVCKVPPLMSGAESHEDTSPLKGRILLVEDEASIRESTRIALEHRGLTVIEAEDGLAALERFRAEPQAFDLVLTDLTMPRMDGRDAFRAIRAIHPTIPVILCSGYDESSCTRELVGEGLAAFLPKPYVMKDLAAIIRRCLAS